MEVTSEKLKIKASLPQLLEALIDYAGLFPPAGLAMRAAVANYARYKAAPHAWMLGRFVVPVARLDEFEAAWRVTGAPADWQLSALVAKPENELPRVIEFNATHASRLRIDALELKASSPDEIAKIAAAVPVGIHAYIEIPVVRDPLPLIAAIRHAGLRAKIRTGGLTAEMFPEAAIIARFLSECAAARLAFKATAGLHHPVRCVKPLTYDPGSARGTMHGFLNVFLAATFARAGHSVDFVTKLLLEEDVGAIRFNDDGVQWRDARLSTSEIAEARADFGIAFGSCSFEEPISDLQSLGLLP